jgi:FMN-dependent NADH-azoreductase
VDRSDRAQGEDFCLWARWPPGLLENKKVVIITARGGAYEKGAPTGPLDFQEPYLRLILGFVGLTEVSFIHSENQMKPDADASFAAATAQIGRILREQKQTIAVEAGKILKQAQRV